MTVSEELFDRSQKVIPGGVNSPVRAFNSVGGTPPFIVDAAGPYVKDADGKEYVDLVGSWGPALLGHRHEAVIEAVHAAVDHGLSFGASTVGETELAETVVDRINRSATKGSAIEQIRLVSTGTEATMTSIRLARGYTGRDKIIKFAGCYHGHVDALLSEAGSGVATLSLPGSAGVTEATTAETIVVPYNDLDAVRTAFDKYEGEIAAVITEAAPCNMGVVTPAEGFNSGLRELTREHGALMIFDEVLTGFRASSAGYWGLTSEHEGGWAPDIFTFGKVIGGGMPIAALGARREMMEYLSPTGPVYQAGTLSGNPLSVAAGIATLRNATGQVYSTIDRISLQLQREITSALNEEGVEHSIQTAGNIFSVAFGTGSQGVRNYEDIKASESYRYGPFFHSMLESGVYLAPSPFEAWFLSASHDDVAMDRIVSALPAAARAAATAEQPR
ncbi:glutamate-1-semialdehyde 2,1-aminomutase [Rothia uropygialis]|uniref:glutamate-1-semialdehyde 2,1-aminomutase n=1 Tax=Kocuria sp. 36 TaxID=1415402 RepID=UPI001EE95DE2|nr:glutamate-1-semialdehyde 2,1-aminomutase [Kocuria sp. 36]